MPELPASNQQRAKDLPRSYHLRILAVTAVFITLSVLNWRCFSPSSSSHGFCYSKQSTNSDSKEKNDLAGMLIVGELVFFIIYWADCKKSASRAYLNNDMEIPDYEDYLKGIRASGPQIGTKVVCYHYENRNGDKVKQATFTGTSYWNYKSFSDATGEILGMNEGKMIKLEVLKSYAFGSEASRQECDNFRKDYIEKNKYRDKCFDYSPVFEIGGFEPHVLVQNKNTERHRCMSEYWYWFWSFLLLSWPYRMWLELKTVHKRIEIKKIAYGFQDQQTVL